MAHAYSKLYNTPSTGLRFFTVYGPAGRHDMANFGSTNKLLKGKTIEIFNYGNCQRDFTSIDDIVDGVIRVVQGAPEKETGEDGLPIPPYTVYNIGNQNPENLLDFVDISQQELIAAGVLTATPLREGLRRFARWYREFYHIRQTCLLRNTKWFFLRCRYSIIIAAALHFWRAAVKLSDPVWTRCAESDFRIRSVLGKSRVIAPDRRGNPFPRRYPRATLCHKRYSSCLFIPASPP